MQTGLADDPYITPFVPGQRRLWPEIDTFSLYTKEELMAYTSLDGYIILVFKAG